jgi:hypothetical protein
MPMPTSEVAMPTALLVRPLVEELAHAHVSSCFWDVVRCRWSCPTGGAARPTTEASRQ